MVAAGPDTQAGDDNDLPRVPGARQAALPARLQSQGNERRRDDSVRVVDGPAAFALFSTLPYAARPVGFKTTLIAIYPRPINALKIDRSSHVFPADEKSQSFSDAPPSTCAM